MLWDVFKNLGEGGQVVWSKMKERSCYSSFDKSAQVLLSESPISY